ncbi:MAG TPA: PLP-dependent aminotransferase family protein [Chloroflexia bacterium]|nr:PLP-dependent aminotransferase family protein [Chloroflexia bacterium]
MTEQADNNPYTPHWSRKVAGGGTAWYVAGVTEPYSLAYGNPDPALFPTEGIEAAAKRVLADPDSAGIALQYGLVQGQPAFMDMLVEKLRTEGGISVTRDNIVVTNGASAAVGLAARALLDEGDVVLAEAPSFPGVLSVLKRAGADLRNLPMGEDGIDVAAADALIDSLLSEGARPRIIYTIPTFQNPSGRTLPEDARRALLVLARKYDLTIVEDDAYRELYYEADKGPLPTTLYALDTEGRVIRTGTMSKILAPGMRLGWAVAQPDIVRRMLLLKDEGGTSTFAQAVAVEYSRNGALAAHIRDLVADYRIRRDTMLDALDTHFPPELGATWTRPDGGFFVWMRLPPEVDQSALAAGARSVGVEYLPGEPCFAQSPATSGTYLRLAYSLLDTQKIEEAIKRLAGQVVDLRS